MRVEVSDSMDSIQKEGADDDKNDDKDDDGGDDDDGDDDCANVTV